MALAQLSRFQFYHDLLAGLGFRNSVCIVVPSPSKAWDAHGGPDPPWKHGVPGGKKDFGLNGDIVSRHLADCGMRGGDFVPTKYWIS
jgi:hypothetical protein